jgi:hypothetical protein
MWNKKPSLEVFREAFYFVHIQAVSVVSKLGKVKYQGDVNQALSPCCDAKATPVLFV